MCEKKNRLLAAKEKQEKNLSLRTVKRFKHVRARKKSLSVTYQFDQGEKKLCFLLEGNKVWLESKTITTVPLGIKWSARFHPDFQGHNKLSSLKSK